MIWPWRDHEGCVVHLLYDKDTGRESGRICKTCDVVETHLLFIPGQPLDGTLVIDPEPVGSA